MIPSVNHIHKRHQRRLAFGARPFCTFRLTVKSIPVPLTRDYSRLLSNDASMNNDSHLAGCRPVASFSIESQEIILHRNERKYSSVFRFQCLKIYFMQKEQIWKCCNWFQFFLVFSFNRSHSQKQQFHCSELATAFIIQPVPFKCVFDVLYRFAAASFVFALTKTEFALRRKSVLLTWWRVCCCVNNISYVSVVFFFVFNKLSHIKGKWKQNKASERMNWLNKKID